VNRLAIIAFAAATIGAAALSGALTHSYDRAQHERVVADLRRAAAATLAEQIGKVRDAERQAQAKLIELEDSYAQLQSRSAAAGAESIRLSGRLDDALDRLRRATPAGGGGGDGAVPASGAGAEGCADLRAALDRTARALERLESGGDQAARIGQHAVDVAAVAARAAQKGEE